MNCWEKGYREIKRGILWELCEFIYALMKKRIMGGKEKKYKVSLFLCMEICLGVQPTETLKPGAEANARMVDIHSSVKLIIIDEKRALSFQRYSNEPFISK